MDRTHYDNLKVSETASSKEIKRAYRLLAQKWHPDKNTHQTEDAEKAIKIINEAYRVLSDPELRQRHDAWIHSVRDESSAHASSTYRDNDQREYSAGHTPFRKRRKRSHPTKNRFRVSKRNFKLALMALFGIPAVLGVIVINADKLTGLIEKSSLTTVNSPGKVAGNNNTGMEPEKVLNKFFDETIQTMRLVTDTDTAITATPKLKQSKKWVINYSEQLANSNRTTKSNAASAVAIGMRGLRLQITRLQSNSRIWAILSPTINPMLQALDRIAG